VSGWLDSDSDSDSDFDSDWLALTGLVWLTDDCRRLALFDCQVILLPTVSLSVHLGLQPLVVNHGHILAWKKISVLSFVRRPSWRVDGTAMSRGHSIFLCCVYVRTHVWMSTATNITMYEGICTYQVCQYGHYAAEYANGIYLLQFRYLKDRMSDRHQVWAFIITYVGLRFCLCFGHLHYREFVWLPPASYIFVM
jgi:hypothetical protein